MHQVSFIYKITEMHGQQNIKVIIGQCNLSTYFLHDMTLVSEKLLHHYQVYCSKHLDVSRKWKSIITGGDGPRCSYGKMTLNRQTFVFGYLQFVERNHLRAARSFRIGKKTDQAAVHEW